MSMRELYQAGGMPALQNAVYSTEGEALSCARGDVVLVQSETTGLIFNAAFDSALLVYDKHYQNEQAGSAAFRDHLEQVAAIVSRYSERKTIIEIGCGKGWFLDMLRKQGQHVIGVDPAYEGAAPDVYCDVFGPNLGLNGEVLILRHVLEHIPDPIGFLSMIATANGGYGKIFIEVPCLDWILTHRAWFDVFYEHVNYFRIQDFHRMFGRIHESGSLFGGQYLYVVADLSSLRPLRPCDVKNVAWPSDFVDTVEEFASIVRASTAENRKSVIWGASSKGVVFAYFLGKLGIRPDAAIDINPAKQGRYLPVTGLPVISPAMALQRLSRDDMILVMNSNYLDEIVADTGSQFSYRTIE